MVSKLEVVSSLLSCPDDGGSLSLETGGLYCPKCLRHFPVLTTGVIEILPREPSPLPRETVSSTYREDYVKAFAQPYVDDGASMAWGAPETMRPDWVRRRQRQVLQTLSVLLKGAGNKTIPCDLSGGAGYYTMEYARFFNLVLHCDLSVESLDYMVHRARARGLDNMVFLRIDYFKLPFRRSLDRVICLDTLIRGEGHERLLLQSIKGAVRPDGFALVDFHNWWHNPLRRLGLLGQTFGDNRSYTRLEAQALLSEVGIRNWKYVPFWQEFDQDNSLRSMALRRVLPPTRLIYQFGGRAGQHTS